MNTKIVGAIVAIVVLAGLGYFLVSKKSNNSQQTPENSSQTNQQPDTTASSSPKSLQDLLALGTTQKCSFQDSTTSGTTYIANGKTRGDFSTTESGNVTSMHTIMDGKTSYTWIDGQTTGFKVAVNASSQSTSGSPSQGVDASKKLDYNCSVWTTDNSMFDLPSGVQFTDLSSFKLPTGN